MEIKIKEFKDRKHNLINKIYNRVVLSIHRKNNFDISHVTADFDIYR